MANKTSSPTDDKTSENDDNEEISINYAITWNRWNGKSNVVDSIFAYAMTLDVIYENADNKPGMVKECRQSN